MAMEGTGLTVADAIALRRDDDRNGMWGDDGFIWIFFLFFMMMWGGNMWGNNAAMQGALTRGDLCESFNFNDLQRSAMGITNGLCDGFYAQNTTMLNGFHGVDNALCAGFNSVNQNISQARFDAQQCCCETNRNIDAVRYENAKNTCDIMQNADRNTQRIIDVMTQNTIQELRDKASTYEFQLSQQAQTANLINQLRPCPIPAYLSCSPYTSYNPLSLTGLTGLAGLNGYGCGCNG